jgi:hypothetical protein
VLHEDMPQLLRELVIRGWCRAAER